MWIFHGSGSPPFLFISSLNYVVDENKVKFRRWMVCKQYYFLLSFRIKQLVRGSTGNRQVVD